MRIARAYLFLFFLTCAALSAQSQGAPKTNDDLSVCLLRPRVDWFWDNLYFTLGNQRLDVGTFDQGNEAILPLLATKQASVAPMLQYRDNMKVANAFLLTGLIGLLLGGAVTAFSCTSTSSSGQVVLVSALLADFVAMIVFDVGVGFRAHAFQFILDAAWEYDASILTDSNTN